MNLEITLANHNEQPVATSRQIAEHFGKRHDNVLRAIENLECSDEFRLLNFEGTDYIDKNGDLQPAFTVTKDGFSFLAMGFTGKEAAKWKEKYIYAFNAMEKEIRRLYAENQALIQSQLTNCHSAIDMLQTDNGVERAKINLPLRAELRKQETLELQNARLDKEITLTQMRERFQESEAARILANAESEKERVDALIASEKARADAGSADGRRWKAHSKRLEERLSTLEGVCGIDRDFDLSEIKRLKLVQTYYRSPK